MKRVLLIVLLLVCKVSFSQCLSGVYTIGGVSPDFSTVGAAVAALQANGVCGPVTMNIRNGNYAEQVQINAIAGTSSINTVTFQSEFGDSSQVTIMFTGTASNPYVIRVGSCQYIRFSKIGVRNNSPSYTNCITIRDSSDHIAVSNCYLYSATLSSNNPVLGLLYVSDFKCDSISIRNSRFEGANIGVSNANTSIGYERICVQGNTFLAQDRNALYLYKAQKCVVRGNRVTGGPGINYLAIYLNGHTDSLLVERNQINSALSGIAVFSCSGFTAGAIRVVNNMVETTNSSGISIGGSSGGVDVFHNTCICSGIYPSSTAFLCNTTSTVLNRICNNVFAETAGGVCIYFSGGNYLSDFNVLWTTGQSFGIYNVSYVNTIGGWRNITGQELNSVISFPQLISSSDLHVATDFSSNVGSYSATGVTMDFDGDARNSIGYPGADEFVRTFSNLDISPVSFYPTGTSTCAGSSPLWVVVRNSGVTSIDSFLVDWSINGVAQPQVRWTGSLVQWDTTHVYLGQVTFTVGNVDTLDAWTSFPNASSDDLVANDSDAHAQPSVWYSGVYTVGGASPDFPTITSAIQALQSAGICGPVTLSIRDGVYTERLDVNSIPGASATNTLTFMSESQDSSLVILESTATSLGTNYVVRLLNQPYTIFDKMTIVQHNTGTYSGVMWLQSSYSTISNCKLRSDNLGANEPNGSVVYGGLADDSSNTVINCRIEGGYCGISFNGQSSVNNYKMKISRCNFVGQSARAIMVHYQNKLTIEYNTMIDTAVVQSSVIFGEFLGDSCTIAYNTIIGHHYSGIVLNGINSYPNPTLVANNVIAIGDPSTSNPLARVALGLNNISNLHIINNSLSTYSLANNVQDRAINVGGDSARMVVRNNILQSRGIGKPVIYGIQGPLYVESDYNAYWSEGGNIVEDYSNFYPQLSTWIQYSGNDSHSVVTNPLFFSAMDLHSQETSLIGAGIYDSRVLTDMDGQVRANPPTIGADEFVAQPEDVGVYQIRIGSPICAGTVQIPLVIKNYGSNVLNSFVVYIDSNNVAFDTISWSGILAPGDTVILYTTSITFVSAHAYDFHAYTVDPNGLPDSAPANDSSFVSAAGVGLSGTYIIGGTTPDYSTINAAIADLMTFGACSSVEFLISDGTYNEQSTIGGFALASVSDTVVFRSLSGDSSLVNWSYVPAIFDGTMSLANSRNLRFSDLTISAAGLYNPNPVEIYGNCTNVVFRRCVFNAPVGGATTPVMVDANFFGKIDSLIFTNCLFSGGDWGLRVDAQVNQKAHMIIRNNIFSDNESGGMWLNSLDTSLIVGNTIVNQQGLSTWEGINISWIEGGVTIEGNYIDARDGQGMYLWTGMQPPGGITMIRNNFIHSKEICIGGNNAGALSFYFNTLRCFGPNPALGYGSGSTTVYGNILMTASTGAVFGTDTTMLDSCDYNVYYATDTMMVLTSNGNYDLSEWQSFSGKDLNSQFLMPFYADTLAPHLSQTNAIENIVPLAGAVYDFDHEVRGPMSDPGADENVYSATNSLVFPGNANNDSIVDAIDILVIGLYNGTNGIPRAVQGNTWAPHVAADWQMQQNNGQDMKHGDCNGDGVIDLNDTTAIALNFGQAENFPIMPYPDPYRSGIPVQLVFPAGSYTPGSWVSADIVVGDSSTGAFSVYGIACAFRLPSGSFEPGTISITPDANWMMSIPSNGFAVSVGDNNGLASLGISRHDHLDANGYGVIGHLNFQIPVTSFGGPVLIQSLYDTAVVSNGTGIVLSGMGGTLLISGVEERNMLSDVFVYPNPAHDIVNVQFVLAEQCDVIVNLKDQSGRVVSKVNHSSMLQGSNQISVPVSGLAAGMYFIEVITTDGVIVRRIAISDK